MARTIGGSSGSPSSRSPSASLLLASSSSRAAGLLGIIPGFGHYHHGSSSSSATSNQGPFSLPLLEGLSHRNRSAAVAVVEEAFQQWNATKVLSRTFDGCHDKKIQRQRPTATSSRRKRRGKTSPAKHATSFGRAVANKNGGGGGAAAAFAGTTASIDRSHDKENQPRQQKQQYYHWLFQGLQSSSLPERRVACKILSQGLCVSGDPNFIWQVLELIVDLLKVDYTNTTLIALLKHLLTEVVDAKTQLAFSINQSMGIPWLCQLIYSIVSSSTTSSSAAGGGGTIPNHHARGGDDEDNSVLMPLLDLLYHLVMIDRSSKYLHQAHLVLWNKKQQQRGSTFDDSSPRNNSSSSSSPSKALFQDNDPHHHHSSKTLVLSPLGCLIAAKHYVSDHHHNKTILSLLLPLVEPESVPKLLPPKLSETSKDDCYLIDTFKGATTKPGSGGISGVNRSSAEGAGAPASSSTAAGAASSLAELRAAVGADGGGGTTSATANAAAGPTSSPSAAAAAQAAAASLESALPGAASTVAQLFSAVYLGGDGSGADGSSPGGEGGGGAASDDHHHLLEDVEMEDADDHHHFDDVEDEHHHDDDEDDDDDEDQNHDDDDHDEDDEEEQHDHDHDEDDDDEEDGQHQDADEDMDEDGDNNKKNKSNNAGGNSSNRMDIDQDEEIDSEDGGDVDVKDHDEDDDDDDDEDDDDEDDDDDEEDDEEDEDHSGIVIHDEDVARLEQGLLELNELDAVRGATGNSSSAATSAAAAAIAARLGQNPGSLSALAGGAASSLAAGLSGVTDPASDHPQTVQERKEIYIKACMQVINAQHPHVVKHPSSPPSPPPSKAATKSASAPAPASIVSAVSPPTSMLSLKAEHALMTSILNIVQPPKKPVNLKFILRRAPTQEEFFRGSLSKNPVTLSMLKSSQGQEEPTVRDLRQHIATDLQMADSAEMLELLVTNKILDVDLKLRVVHQVTWKDHLIQNAPPSGSSAANAASSALSSFLGGRGGARSFISTGSGLSMIFNSGLDRSLIAAGGGPITSETPLSALPPMIVTYRLTGVDGEATEDTITTLEDPEAPSETASPEQVEAMMEKKFGITRLVTGGRGVSVLLRSVDRHVSDVLRRIRRDSIGRGGGRNPSRDQFKEASPCSALTLLTCCSKLASNRKLLLETRAPTILLRLLLDALHSLEEQQEFGGNKKSESNATAQSLQELIEVLASDMLSSSTTQGTSAAVVASPSSSSSDENDTEQDTSTLRLLIQGIETSSLSRPLRNVIAKLLPYLTYGQAPLAKELALEFVRHVQVDRLGDCENEDDLLEQVTGGRRYILMATFVHASISLRPNEVCNSLRKELIGCGFVQGIANFLLRGVPTEPPTWTASLWLKGEQQKINGNSKRKEQLEREWREYTQRRGLKIAFDILIGLSKQHGPTQEALGKYVASNKVSLIRACHWLEATSDNTSARVSLNGLGLVAETLLDELATDASPVVSQVKTCRRKTRDRKKEIAMERRSKALVSMSSFGPLAGAATLGDAGNKSSSSSPGAAAASGTAGGSVRSTMASIVAPVWDLFQGSSSSQSGNNNDSSTSPPPAKRRRRNQQSPAPATKKPAWMVEMENMEDETGLTCCVCQEGRTLQPKEILGLYAHVKKITVPLSQGGGRNNIDGTTLLVSLPSTVPASIAGTHAGNAWFPSAMGARNDLSSSSRSNLSSSVASSRRATYFTTTVAAGNAIHFSCHTKARQADRNHPKAPKSEWEGASLRNSRVQCNVILPLVSSRSSKVPLVAVDVALTDHQTAVSNLLGARPKSMLWTVLHDVRFLLLRMAYGEALNADCGGGSLQSNAQLVYYQLLMADMFEKDAQLDAPDTSQHARGLSAGFLAACSIIKANGGGTAASENNAMLRGISDAAPMASLTGVIFFNNKDDYSRSSANKASSSSSSDDHDDGAPHPKRRWVVGRENFLRGLLNCTGRRHALGVTNSGCLTGRTAGNKRSRSSSAFADWDIVDEEDILMDIGGSGSTTSALSPERAAALKRSASSSKVGIDDFRDALRPMIVYFAMMDQISTDFVLNMDDTKVEENAANLVQVIEDCRRCKNIKDLLNKAKVTLSEDEIIDELQRGMMSA